MRAPAPLLVVAALLATVACQPKPFVERAEPRPAADIGYEVSIYETVLPITLKRVDGDAAARLDRFVAAMDGAALRRAIVEVPPGYGEIGGAVAGYLAAQGLEVAVAEVPTTGIMISGDQVDVVASRCPDFVTARLSHPLDPLWGNPNPANDLAFGCANDSNLEAMVADPSDFGIGARTDPPSATSAVGAVRRYQENKVTPLPERSLETGL